jgi:hypothetical protein
MATPSGRAVFQMMGVSFSSPKALALIGFAPTGFGVIGFNGASGADRSLGL